jgi:hypothetical protein
MDFDDTDDSNRAADRPPHARHEINGDPGTV